MRHCQILWTGTPSAAVVLLEAFPQVEGRVEQPAGEGEATGTGEAVGHRQGPGAKVEGAGSSSPRSTSKLATGAAHGAQADAVHQAVEVTALGHSLIASKPGA